MTTSWASLAAKPAPPTEHTKPTTLKDKSIAVVDANAIIGLGLGIRSLVDVLYTTEDVLNEIRDSRSRQVVEQLEFVCGVPADESIRAVSTFARQTGDLHQLSTEDVRLLALAHTLEVELHGAEHLRHEPPQPRRSSRVAPRGGLPGWGNNGQSDEWDAIDAFGDEPESSDETGDSEDGSVASDVDAGPSTSGQITDERDDVGGEGWEVVKKSANAARRSQRKERRIADSEANGLAAIGEDGALADGVAPHDHDGAADMADDGAVDDEATGAGAYVSNVCLVTADFPMQNVCLQMGLRLVTKDGVRITKLQRFVLRCEGCSTVSQDTSKLFCPACGHATLVRVEVTIGPDGTNVYGVRRKHVLKGTRYSLPKPTGGRNQANPILSEDVYNAKVRKPRKKVADASDDPFEGTTFGDLKKFQNQPDHIAKGLSHLTANFRNNPNERKATMRTNRRKR